MNPEFRRQLWLQFSLSRLIVPPLLLLVVVMGVYGMVDNSEVAVNAIPRSIAWVAAGLFLLVVGVMGTHAAGTSVVDEVNDHTWDQQRMNAMTPWSMTWGKLVGATSFAWYCGAWCMGVAVTAAWMGDAEIPIFRTSAMALLSGILLQTTLFTVQLQMVQSGRKAIRRGSVPVLLVVMLWAIIPWLTDGIRDGVLMWWGQTFERINFSLFSLVFFTVCMVITAWRTMAEVLLVRQWPWGWPVFALLISTYISGFVPEYRATTWCAIALGMSVAMSYIPLLTESQTYPHWQRIVARAKLGQWKIVLQSQPRWVSTLVLGLPLVVVLASMSMLPGLPKGWLVFNPVVIWLTLLRDCALALWIGFSVTQARRTLSFPVVMVVLHGLLPWVLGIAGGSPQWSGIIEPLLANAPYGIFIALVQVAVALGLVLRRWRSAR